MNFGSASSIEQGLKAPYSNQVERTDTFYEKPYVKCKTCLNSRFRCKQCLQELACKLKTIQHISQKKITASANTYDPPTTRQRLLPKFRQTQIKPREISISAETEASPVQQTKPMLLPKALLRRQQIMFEGPGTAEAPQNLPKHNKPHELSQIKGNSRARAEPFRDPTLQAYRSIKTVNIARKTLHLDHVPEEEATDNLKQVLQASINKQLIELKCFDQGANYRRYKSVFNIRSNHVRDQEIAAHQSPQKAVTRTQSYLTEDSSPGPVSKLSIQTIQVPVEERVQPRLQLLKSSLCAAKSKQIVVNIRKEKNQLSEKQKQFQSNTVLPLVRQLSIQEKVKASKTQYKTNSKKTSFRVKDTGWKAERVSGWEIDKDPNFQLQY